MRIDKVWAAFWFGTALTAILIVIYQTDVIGAGFRALDCGIKANINENGQRVYHRPGQRSYKEVRIEFMEGERYFCNEENARMNGWRRAWY